MKLLMENWKKYLKEAEKAERGSEKRAPDQNILSAAADALAAATPGSMAFLGDVLWYLGIDDRQKSDPSIAKEEVEERASEIIKDALTTAANAPTTAVDAKDIQGLSPEEAFPQSHAAAKEPAADKAPMTEDEITDEDILRSALFAVQNSAFDEGRNVRGTLAYLSEVARSVGMTKAAKLHHRHEQVKHIARIIKRALHAAWDRYDMDQLPSVGPDAEDAPFEE